MLLFVHQKDVVDELLGFLQILCRSSYNPLSAEVGAEISNFDDLDIADVLQTSTCWVCTGVLPGADPISTYSYSSCCFFFYGTSRHQCDDRRVHGIFLGLE